MDCSIFVDYQVNGRRGLGIVVVFKLLVFRSLSCDEVDSICFVILPFLLHCCEGSAPVMR